MFQFPGLAAMHLCIQCMLIQESRAHHLFVGSPKLFADFHAFRRLSIPRHPPCALSNLTIGISNLNPIPQPLTYANSRRIGPHSISARTPIDIAPIHIGASLGLHFRLSIFNCARSNQYQLLRLLFRTTKFTSPVSNFHCCAPLPLTYVSSKEYAQ